MSVTLEFIIHLVISLLLGAAIGMERQWRQRMAGLRTNMLVSLGAAMFVSLAGNIGGDAVGRVTSYVVSGIGFLGAGVIMKHGMSISGLNTAATLWCSGAIGSFCGAGYLTEATIGACLIVFTHVIMRPVGVRLSQVSGKKRGTSHTDYLVSLKCMKKNEYHIRSLLIQYINENKKLFLQSLTSTDDFNSPHVTINAEVVSTSSEDSEIENITGKLSSEKNISNIRWRITREYNDL